MAKGHVRIIKENLRLPVGESPKAISFDLEPGEQVIRVEELGPRGHRGRKTADWTITATVVRYEGEDHSDRPMPKRVPHARKAKS